MRRWGLLSGRDKTFLLSYKESKPAPGPAQAPFQGVDGVFTDGYKNMQSISGVHKHRATELCTVAPNILQPSV
jgi:23S rRNA U2552 (ribose-2'-O)-methylase RlmE/FtsJ